MMQDSVAWLETKFEREFAEHEAEKAGEDIRSMPDEPAGMAHDEAEWQLWLLSTHLIGSGNSREAEAQ
jgi:hypothetical protein